MDNLGHSDSDVLSPGDGSDPQAFAFTIAFGDQKVDDTKKLKIHERLSSSSKHRRNPSLPDFGVQNQLSYHGEGQVEQPPAVKCYVKKTKSPIDENKPKNINGRRSSLNDIDVKKPCQLNETYNAGGNFFEDEKSDTHSEAGTYTVDKEDEEDDGELLNVSHGSAPLNPNHKWINDWVCKVAEQNFQYVDEPPIIPSGKGSSASSPSASKIPSPINTLPSKLKIKPSKVNENNNGVKTVVSKLNGSLHRRSSSLSAKDYADTRASESSLETESFLRPAETVMVALQSRVRLSLDPRDLKPTRKETIEKPHPPSTASDTDTNSESEGKGFRKPSGTPFTSARLNRAFSLRKAKAEPDAESRRSGASGKEEVQRPTTPHELRRGNNSSRSTPSPNPIKSKPPVTSPFSRIDCGRFSMRSSVSATTPKTTSLLAPVVKTQVGAVRKPNTNGRGPSVEFQNWKRRKSFDPMKAAAEGRKKEMAKKAALNQTMTQSVTLGNTIRARNGNPVLRSASFHCTPQIARLDPEEDMGSMEEYEDSPASSWISNHPVLPPNSPSKGLLGRPPPVLPLVRSGVSSSRCSLNSETHSSPSHRVRSEVVDNLVMSAIHDLSHKLKRKSCHLLKKLNSLYDADEERADRLRDEIAVLELRKDSNSSPSHSVTSRDLSATLKNLKSLDNVLTVLDDVLFDENLEVCIDN